MSRRYELSERKTERNKAIAREYTSGATVRQIARRYRITPSTVDRILDREEVTRRPPRWSEPRKPKKAGGRHDRTQARP